MRDRQKCLMIGAGHREPKRFIVTPTSAPQEFTDWVRLDVNPECHPDVLFDLNRIEKGEKLPFPDDTFDEIHAYEVMEHYGRQGDYEGFFTGMRELWRVLKLHGNLIGTCPSDPAWLWGDPGHTRTISIQTLSFLNKSMYDRLGKGATSDYRRYVDPCWWLPCGEIVEGSFRFGMVKVNR